MMKGYLHQVWLILMSFLLFAGLFMPIGQFSNEEGATALLTNFRLNFIEGDSAGALWALGAILIAALAVTLFELLLSGFRNFTLQKRLLVFIALLIAGYYIIFILYVILLRKDAMFRPQWAGAFPLIALILDFITLWSIMRVEAAIITGAGSFRLRD